MGKFTVVPEDTFQKLQLNAGILVEEFTPESGEFKKLLGATTGGITFNSNPEFSDFGSDVDNFPNNMLEMKRLTSMDPTMSGTFVTVSPEMIKSLIGAADIDATTHIVPRGYLEKTDFKDVWWIGDYSDVNTGENAGYLAIHLINALNTAGIQITSSKDEKGQFAFEFHGHYSLDAQDRVPFEIYCKAGSADE